MSCFLCLNTVLEENSFFIWVRLADLKRMLLDFMHPIFYWHFIIYTHSTFFTGIWNQKTYWLIRKVMSKLQISVFQRKTFRDIMKQKVFVELLNIWRQKYCKEWVMVKQVTGGVLVQSFTKCFVVNHHFTTEIKKSCSETSNILSQFYTTHL